MKTHNDKIELWQMSGEILRLILKKVGVSQAAFAMYCKAQKEKKCLRLATSAKAMNRLAGKKLVPDIYQKLLEEFLGRRIFDKWLNYYKQERPEEFIMTD